MPRTSYAEPWDWDDGVRLFGEDAIIAGVEPRTWEDWRLNRKIPEHRILKVLRARSLPPSDGDRSILVALRAAMDELDRAAWMFFMDVLKHRHDTRSVEWSAISAVVLAFLRRSGDSPTPQSEKPRRRPTKPVSGR
jgi:hypothetical protein